MAYDGPIWEGVYSSFGEVPVVGPGFDGDMWIVNSLKKIKLLQEEAENNAPLSPTSNYREALLPLLAAFVYHENKELKILDFGGGIGFTYFQTVYGLPQVENIEYHIFERENVCQAGSRFFGTKYNNLFFHSQLPQEAGAFDVIHSGSALQYIDDWKQIISRLCELSKRYLLLVDIPAGNIPTFVSAQNYYGSKIPTRFFNVREFISFINKCGYDLMFNSMFQPTIHGVGQSLPMQNFEEKYRLKQACNLLFVKSTVPANN
jgi:putative methyltransferase (TIGR04325 family)